jgi:hypothetical protein
MRVESNKVESCSRCKVTQVRNLISARSLEEVEQEHQGGEVQDVKMHMQEMRFC